MNELELLSTRLEQCFEKSTFYGPTLGEGTFHGPSLLDALNNVEHVEANRRPLPNTYFIWEITDHCSFWMNEACKAVENKSLTSVSGFEDWTISGAMEREWVKSKEKLVEAYARLNALIKGRDEKKLNNVVESRFHGNLFKFTVRKMLYGIIDHTLYHAGQVCLLKPDK
jgi:hypothetical protein